MEGGGKGPSGEYSFILITSQFRDLPGRNSHHSYSQTKGKKNSRDCLCPGFGALLSPECITVTGPGLHA